jgi:hypothetical protein
MIYYLGDVAFIPQKDAQGNVLTGIFDANGNPITGLNRPQVDTLFGLLNLESFTVIARFKFWDEHTGKPLIWPDTLLDYADIVMPPDSSYSATLIPGNGFAHPPGEFEGHGTVEFFYQNPNPFGIVPLNVYVYSMISGGNWSSKDPSLEGPVLQNIEEKSLWIFPYAIPKWTDSNHAGGDAYDTGIAIQNFSDSDATVDIMYQVNQEYPDAGKQYEANGIKVPANGGYRAFLSDIIPNLPDISEGHLIVISSAPAQLFLSLAICTRNFLFSSGELPL